MQSRNMNVIQEARVIKSGTKKAALLLKYLGITLMMNENDSKKRAIAITLLLSHSRDLLTEFTEDQLSTILTMVVGKKFSMNIIKRPIETVRGFEVTANNFRAHEDAPRIK